MNELLAREPALSVAGLVAVAGFLFQNGVTNVPTDQAAGAAVTIAGLQGLITRQQVFSPRTAEQKLTAPVDPGALGQWLTRAKAVNYAEPAMATALVSVLLAFVFQMAAGVNLGQALASSAGIAGFQGLATRQMVTSPKTVANGRLQATAPALEQILQSALPAGQRRQDRASV
jgi:hypothetical protein